MWRYLGIVLLCVGGMVGGAWADNLTLTVLDAVSGEAIKGAAVVIRANGSYPAGGGFTTDAEGKCSLATQPGASYVSLLIRHDGHVTTTVAWDSHGREAVAIPQAFAVKVPRAKTISGTVVDPEGQPVPDAKVFLTYWPDTERVKEQPAVAPRLPDEMVETDAGGVWVYTGAPTDVLDRLQIRIEHPDFIKNQPMVVPPATALLDGSAKLTLDRGFTVTGRVVGPDGKPVARATVTTQQHHYVSNDYGVKVQTNAEGRFELPHMAAATLPVTVMARGFAPEMQRVNVAPGMGAIEFKLAAGKALRGRVVDSQGKPIAGAYLMFDEWRNLSAIPWNTTTGADGRFTMPDAPADPFTIRVSKEGYRYILRHRVEGPDEQITIQMTPVVHLSGSVTDAETGKAIDKFRIIEGAALWQFRPPFFQFDRPHQFKEGKYDLNIENHNEVVGSYIRVEADGYEPFVSRPLQGTEKLDIALRHGKDLAGTVRNPDGTPSPDAEVRLVLPGAQVDMRDGKVSRVDGPSAKTDASGQFRLAPQTGEFELLVATDAGYTIVPVSSGQTGVQLQLSKWAAMEGTYNPTGQPAVLSLFVGVEPLRDLRNPSAMYIWGYGATTDEQGRYRIARMPHYDGTMVTVQIGQLSQEVDQRRWMPMQLKAGETTRWDVGSPDGVTVSGKLMPASAADALAGARGMVLLIPAWSKAAAQWPMEWADAMKLGGMTYRADVRPDGSFAIPDVAPGQYEYMISLYSGQQYAGASGAVTVPAGARTADLGTLSYARSTPLRAGDSLPDALGTTMDGQPIRAADHAGKHVVIVVWDSCTGTADAELPHLEKLGEALQADPKVALVSLNRDPISCSSLGRPKRPATLQGPAWVRGYLTARDNDTGVRLAGEKRPAILIASPEGKVLATGLKAEETADKLRELMGQK